MPTPDQTPTPEPVVMLDRGGNAHVVPADRVASALASGWTQESEEGRIGRVRSDQRTEDYGGIGGKVVAGLTGLNRGATLGASDVLGNVLGYGGALHDVRDANPGISTAANIVGAIAPTVLSGGTAAPAGAVAKLGTRIAESGGGGLLRETAAGAFEGAAQNTGAYLSDVALGDKDLSGEGFVGAMGSGALFGGGTVAGLKLSAKAFEKARALFPARALESRAAEEAPGIASDLAPADQPIAAAELSIHPEDAVKIPARRMFAVDESAAEAATHAERQASSALESHLGDSDELLSTARRSLEDDVRMRQAQEMAFGGGPEMAAAPAAAPTLEEQLAATVGGIKKGRSFRELSEQGLQDARQAKIAAAAADLEEANAAVKAFLGKNVKPNGNHALADQIAESIPSAITPEGGGVDVNAALRKMLDRNPIEQEKNIGEGIRVIGDHEAAQAKMVEALGDQAPPNAAAHAAEYQAKLEAQLAKQTNVQALAADDMARSVETQAAGGATAKTSRARDILKGASDAAAAAHMLHAMGIPGVPDPASIPVVGPVLGLFLKAKAMGMMAKRIGLKIPATAEAVIASKSAGTQQRVIKAMDAFLSGAQKTVDAAARKAAQPAAVLGHVLFSDGSKPVPPKGANEVERLLAARRDELARAAQPGAIDDAVRQQVKASDPAMVQAITDAVKRKLAYLDSVMPKPPIAPGMLPGAAAAWRPAPGAVTSYVRAQLAADDPAHVFEELGRSWSVSLESAEALRNVYPRLFQQAQMQVLHRAQDMSSPLPYEKRVALSQLFRVPLDGTMGPGFQTAIAAGSAPQGTPPVQPPTAGQGLRADITLGARTGTRLDQE